MVSATLLAGDIGGTKTLLSLYGWNGSRLALLREERFVSGEWDDLAPMICHFLGDPQAPPKPSPAAACLAVAGPVLGGKARLTNLPWRLVEGDLARACAIPRVELVNDFAVLLHGLPFLGSPQLACVREGTAMPEEPVLILGAGTGLGVALGIPTAAGLRAVASEAAHAEFAPRNEAEWALRQWLRHDLALERVSIERVVSGTGLGHVARWLLHERDPEGQHPLQELARRWHGSVDPADLPAAVAHGAEQGDPLAGEAMALWLSAYGSVVGDLALASLSRGGIWLAGGTAAKQLTSLRSPAFLEAFLAKGRLRPTLEPMPIQAVIDPQVGSFSAACRARALLA
ncbi:MAG: glucokinase [Cyanobium sp.]